MDPVTLDEPAVLLMWQESAGDLRLRRYNISDYAWKFQHRRLVAAGYQPRVKFCRNNLP